MIDSKASKVGDKGRRGGSEEGRERDRRGGSPFLAKFSQRQRGQLRDQVGLAGAGSITNSSGHWRSINDGFRYRRIVREGEKGER